MMAFCWQRFGIEHAICGKSLLKNFNANSIAYWLDWLVPEQFNVQVVSPIFRREAKEMIQTDATFNVEYTVRTIPNSLIKAWKNVTVTPCLSLPPPNSFIPTRFDLKEQSSGKNHQSNVPTKIAEDEYMKLWHLQDQTYKVPKAFYGLAFKRFVHYSL